jgi:hypothetical protein
VIFFVNRHMKQIFLLACALLMLLLPVVDLAESSTSIVQNGQVQHSSFHTALGMTQDVGLPVTGINREGMKVLKPNEFIGRDKTSSHISCKAIAEATQGLSHIALRRALQTTQIRFRQELFEAPVSCRAPPAFSSLQYHI